MRFTRSPFRIRPVGVLIAVLLAAGLGPRIASRGWGHGAATRSARVTSLPGSGLAPWEREKTIRIELLGAQTVRIAVLDVMGRTVHATPEIMYSPGRHDLTWYGTDTAGVGVAGGTYLARIDFGGTRSEERWLVLGP